MIQDKYTIYERWQSEAHFAAYLLVAAYHRTNHLFIVHRYTAVTPLHVVAAAFERVPFAASTLPLGFGVYVCVGGVISRER